MAAHGDHHDPSDAHDDDHAHAAHDDPDALDPDEPRTPLWLPLVGLCLLLASVIWVLAARPAGPTAAELQKPATSAAAPPPQGAAPPPQGAAPPPGGGH